MTMRKYSDAELATIISEVRQEMSDLFKSESMNLKKADYKDEASPEAGSEDQEDKAPAPEQSPAEDKQAPEMGAESEDAAPQAEASQAAPPSEEAAPEADPMKALEQAYAQLSPEELDMHKQAIEAVMMSKQPAQENSPPAPSAPIAGEASKPLSPEATMAAKSESDDKFDALKKDADSAKAELADVKKNLELVTKAFELVLNKPERKAITGKDIIAKAEEMDVKKLSKTEITAKLSKATKDPSLSKADRNLVNGFYANRVDVSAVAHLLK